MLETGKPFTVDCLVARVSVEGKNYVFTACVQQVIKSSLLWVNLKINYIAPYFIG